MSDASNTSGDTASDAPLFQKLDEQERIYAPDQVPNTILPEDEVDADGGVTHSSTTNSDQGHIAGADGNRSTVPIIGVRPDIGITQPVPTPAVIDNRQDATTNS